MRGARRPARAAVALLAAMLCVPALAAAQGRIELSAGARWIGSSGYPSVTADQAAPGGTPRALFASRSDLEGSIGPAGTIGVRIGRVVILESAFAFGPTGLRTRISDDEEGAPDATVRASVRQFLLEGGLLVMPERWRSGRVRVFATAGAGYLRHLYEGRTLLETGRSTYAGGGLYYERVSAGRSRIKASGLRADVRLLILHGGVAPDSNGHPSPAATLSVFARF